MAAITLAEAKAKLAEYMALETKINTMGQSYSKGARQQQRADLTAAQGGVKMWRAICQELDPNEYDNRASVGVVR